MFPRFFKAVFSLVLLVGLYVLLIWGGWWFISISTSNLVGLMAAVAIVCIVWGTVALYSVAIVKHILKSQRPENQETDSWKNDD